LNAVIGKEEGGSETESETIGPKPKWKSETAGTMVSVKGFRTVLAVIRDNSKENKDQGIPIGGYFRAS